jgi:hypothetical protein
MRWWVLGEFTSEAELRAAVSAMRGDGFAQLDAHSPVPVAGLSDALGLKPSRLTWVVFFAGLSGAAVGYTIQWWCNAVDWPLNVGGRPLHSAPSLIPVTFETGILIGASSLVFVLVALVFRFPKLSHPVFLLERFASASIDRFWVSLPTTEPAVREKALATLRRLGAQSVAAVEEPR